MDTKQIIRTLAIRPEVKKKLLAKFDKLDSEKRLYIGRILWRTLDAIREVRELEIALSKMITDPHYSDSASINIDSLLRRQLPAEVYSEALQEMEDQFEKYPEYFSHYIVDVVSNRLNDLV